MLKFNEDTRVKIPATLQFLRIGYSYQSMKDADIDFNTKIFVNRFKPALEKINGKSFTDAEIEALLSEIHTLIRNNDLGRSWYLRLIDGANDIHLVDFNHPENNDLAVVDELPFTIEKDTEDGSFRPDINILINGMPLAFLEVKKPNNENGIQAEFNRMIGDRLKNPAYRKFFNLIQFVSFSNNMEYENGDDAQAEVVKAGSFYSSPNGLKTRFSFFRENDKNYHEDYPYKSLDDDFCRDIIKDLGYNPAVFDLPEFKTNDSVMTPCNRFITSFYDKKRILFLLKYGICYLKASNNNPPEKHIMRYPQFFASQRLLARLDKNEKRGIIWHCQGSGKTELAVYLNRILHDYYAKKSIITRFYFVVDRLELLRQDNGEFSNRYLQVTNVNTRKEFSSELNKVLPKSSLDGKIGEFVVVNIQKFEEAIPKAVNEYNTNIQRVFFIDEAHRSYALNGSYFKNLILCDPNAVYVALTGTPLLSKKERSNLKFGDYIHKYFYDASIADGYTLRIKKEKIDTVVKSDIKMNLQMEDPDLNSADVYESDPYISYLGKYIEKDFKGFRLINQDDSIGGMIVCRSNLQAKKLHAWFQKNSKLSTGLVITDEGDPRQAEANKNNQNDFKYEGHPDLLIVEYMLTTGYDVSRLKKMYLLRGPHAQGLLQTISRVNRPYKSPEGKIYHYGYITDFVDIEEEYDRTLNEYLKELEKDINDVDDDENQHNSLNGLLVDVDTIRQKLKTYEETLKFIIDEDNLEKFSRTLSYFNKDALLKIRQQLKGIKDCYVELMLSNAMDDAAAIDIERINKKLRLTQEKIDFINLKEEPVRMLDLISDEEVVEIVYEFIKTSVSVIDLSRFDPEDARYKRFNRTLKNVKHEISKNRNKADIRMVSLDAALQQLFARMDIHSLDDLDSLSDELSAILKKAMAINAENDRLAARYDGNFGLVKTYQDIMTDRPELNNKDVEAAVGLVYEKIKDAIAADILVVQGRQGFIDETKKKVVKELLKNGLYKKLGLKTWMETFLSDMYNNLQIYR
ncbi:DEAD/DEAH box helicase family protein [Acidaminococcus timonensis]|mgnify:CR=1 FL=1|uniref:DEAD/DEAH box helicase family protein n=1 Tax=Acidaminococcus timonensis TaxID=1871002 RepID=UPI0029434B51|nr:DEAD/DEAH box helicase family protein [Acidaminococcus timonensis]